MASYNPPKENLAIFDPVAFDTLNTGLTQAEAELIFLKYPNAQGLENLQAISVNGDAQFNTNVDIGSLGTANLQPEFTTNKTKLIIGNSGNGEMEVECPINVGGFGLINMEGSQLLLQSNSYINQGSTNTTANSLGLTNFASTTPPTSSQTIPASNDNSTNIPTTAWVQTAITGSIPASLLGLNNTWTGTQNWTNTAEGSLTSSATQPASNDSSTKIPTTAWVQSAISAPILQTNTAEHYSTALNNIYPFGTTLSGIPLINFADVGTYASTYGMNYWDAVVFDFVFNLTISGVNTGGTDAGGVIINNNQVSGTLYVYPTAFTTTFGVVASPYFYLNGGVNSTSAGASSYYNCPLTTYTPNGRPFWVNGLLNGANAMVCMPCNTINDGTNAQLIFQFEPIGWNSTTICNWGLSITLRNSGKIPVSKISTQNFNINNI